MANIIWNGLGPIFPKQLPLELQKDKVGSNFDVKIILSISE